MNVASMRLPCVRHTDPAELLVSIKLYFAATIRNWQMPNLELLSMHTSGYQYTSIWNGLLLKVSGLSLLPGIEPFMQVFRWRRP
jgi:hypothetical protein